MEAISPYMEIATSYIATPYGVAALAGVILVSVLLLVFSTQKEITYEDYSKQMSQPLSISTKASAQPKKQKKTIRQRKSKKNKEQEQLEPEDEAQYDIVAVEEVPAPEDIPATFTEPQDQPRKKLKPKKRKAKKEIVKEEVKEEVVEEVVAEEVVEEEEIVVEEAAVPEPEVVPEPAELEEAILEPEAEDEAPVQIEIEEAAPPVVQVEAAIPTKAAAPVVTEKRVKKSKKKVQDVGGSGNIFQIVDQADLSETDIETLLAILKSKEGDDNWSTGKSASDSKDSLRKKVQHAQASIADLEHTIDMLKQDMIDNGDDKVKLTNEMRQLEKRHLKEREGLSSQLNQLNHVTQSRQEELARLKKEIEDRDRINNNLQIQLQQHRNNPSLNPNIDLKNRVVELEAVSSPRKKLNSSEGLIAQLCKLQEELNESKEQYNDLERNLSQVNTMERKLLDKDDCITDLKKQLVDLGNELKAVSTTDTALVEAQGQTMSLRAELEKLQDCVGDVESTRSQLEELRVEHETLRSELALTKDSELSSKLAAAAHEKMEQEVAARASAPPADDGEQALKSELEAAQSQVTALQTEVKTCKEKISELEKTPSESSMSSTVDISAEIAEQLQVAETQLQNVREEQESVKSELTAAVEERDAQTAQIAQLEGEMSAARDAHAVELAAAREAIVEVAPAPDTSAQEALDSMKSDLTAVQGECMSHVAEIERLRRQLPAPGSAEKLDLANQERDKAQADAKRFQEVLSKTEGILSQLQTKFETDIQKWSKDLEDKRHELEAERGRTLALEQKLTKEAATSQNVASLTQTVDEVTEKLRVSEEALSSERRWHSENLLKLNELETNASQSAAKTEDVETLQKANELEQKWHAQTLTQLQQVNGAMLKCKNNLIEEQERNHMMNKLLKEANSDVTLLQEKLSTKNSEIAQLATHNEDLKQQLCEAAGAQNETHELQSKLDQAVVVAKRVQQLQEEVSDLKGVSEESQNAEANQSAEKKFTSI